MALKIRRAASLAVAAAAMGAMVMGAGPAQAAEEAWECPADYMCAWAWPGGDGPRVALINAIPDLSKFGNGSMNDQISSGFNNNRGNSFCFYTEAYYKGAMYVSRPGTRGWFPHNDAYSSIRIC
ncbi:peptidase inhibitor family I36 protein [Amycolatopsis japonica]|uniref:peptidase inhibitor family I36 protein n=1 Tax=Amycolatopsis japonica TaxID=208439 RepID=UPI0033EF18DE